MKTLDAHDIETYLASGEWRGKAGGYAIQGKAARFVTRIVGSYSAIVGLPVFETVAMLSGVGLRSRKMEKIMGHEVLISVRDATARIAQIEDGRLVDFRLPRWGKNRPTPPTG